jgi:hypothetical protein
MTRNLTMSDGEWEAEQAQALDPDLTSFALEKLPRRDEDLFRLSPYNSDVRHRLGHHQTYWKARHIHYGCQLFRSVQKWHTAAKQISNTCRGFAA